MFQCPLCNESYPTERGRSIHARLRHGIMSDNPKTRSNNKSRARATGTSTPALNEYVPQPGYIGLAIAVIECAARDGDPWLRELQEALCNNSR